MDVITYSLYRCLIHYLSPFQRLFENSYVEVKSMLSNASGVLSSLGSMLTRLTKIDFRVAVGEGAKKRRCWTTNPYENKYTTKLHYRVRKILHIRQVDNEVRSLLVSSSSMNVDHKVKNSFQVSSPLFDFRSILLFFA